MVKTIMFNNGVDAVVRIDATHLFSWKFKGVNCASEDYSLGTVSSLDFEFETDLEVKYIKDQTTVLIYLGTNNNADYCGYVTGIERVKSTKNHYHVSVTDRAESLDTPIDESDLTPVENETIAQLATRLDIPYDSTVGVNANYVVNPNWGYSGVTKRDVMRWICQLQGLNFGGSPELENSGGVNINNWFAPTTFSTSNSFNFTPSGVKLIDKADYMTQQIDKIWFGNDSSDTGLSYGSGNQALLIPINPLINYEDTSFLQPLYNKVNSLISYTPMKITTYLDNYYYLLYLLHSQQRFWWMSYTEDGTTYSCPVFNWEASPSGITLEGTGSPDRTTTNAYLGGEISNAGKFNKFSRTLDETKSEVGNLSGQVSTISQTAASLTIAVSDKVGYDEIISSINQTAETITIDANKINLNGIVEVGPSDSQPTAFLTVISSQSAMSGQHSRLKLYNNSVYVNTYDSNDNEICSNVQQGSLTGLYSKGEVNGVTYSYPNVLLMSHAGSEAHPSGSGYGHIMLYNSEWLRAHGITTTENYKPSITLSAGDTADASGWATFFNVDSNGQQKPRIELTTLNSGQIVLKDDNGYGVKLNSEGRGVLLLKPTTTTYPYAYYENNKLQIYNSASTSTLVNPNGVTAYGSTTNKTEITKDGVLVYGDNGSGTPKTKGQYRGDSLTVGTAPSNTVYTDISPNKITWWNSGYNPVNQLVPQGASVIEHGTSGNWEYRKWSDGTYECWRTVTYSKATLDSNTPSADRTWGSLYSRILPALTYPVTFKKAPHEHLSPAGTSSSTSYGNSYWICNQGGTTGPTTNQSGSYQALRPTDFGQGVCIEYYVKGEV